MPTGDPLAADIDRWAADHSLSVSLASYRHEIDAWRAMTGADRVGSVLEIGAGVGLFAATLLDTGAAGRVTTLDPITGDEGSTEREFNRYRDRLTDRYPDRLTFRRGWFPDDTPDATFDCVVARNAVHHIYERHSTTRRETVAGLRAAFDCVAPGGHVTLVETEPPGPLLRAAYLAHRTLGDGTWMDWAGKRPIDDWRRLLAAAGGRDVKTRRLPFHRTIDRPLARPVSRAVSNRALVVATTGD